MAGRLFAYFLGFKYPKSIAGYSAPEVDVALLRGELDARANLATSMLRRNRPAGRKESDGLPFDHGGSFGSETSSFPHVPEIETFAKSDQERKVLAVWRVFRLVGSP